MNENRTENGINQLPETPVYAVIPAAGTGSRMQLAQNKQFLMLGRYPVIIRTLRIMETHPRIKGYLVVAAADEVTAMCQLIESHRMTRCLGVAAGGSTRQASVAFGLQALSSCCSDLQTSLILVHDGARCFLPSDVIDRVIDGIISRGACGAAVQVKDTIKQARPDGFVERTLDRSQLWAMQTPQGASYAQMRRAYDLAEISNWQGTDDLALLEMAGYPVWLAAGDYLNIKLTTPEDRLLGERLASLADNRETDGQPVIDAQADVP